MRMAKYKIVDVRLDGDQVGIVLEGKWKWKDKEIDDGFAIWMTIDEFKQLLDEGGNINKDTLKQILAGKVRERLQFLKQIHAEREAKEKEHKSKIEKVKEVIKDLEVEDSLDESEDGSGSENENEE